MEQYYDYNHKYKAKDKLFTPLHGIKLKDGLFRQIFDNNNRFTLTQLDHDKMRYWFDIKRGIPTTAEPYRHAQFEDLLKGQTASQYLMCAGNALRWEENEELRKGMEEIMDYLEDSQEDDGFLMPINKFDFAFREYPGYVRIWLTYALIAAANGGDKRALKMLRLWQDWFNNCPDLPIVKYLELAYQAVVASPLVYATEVGVPDDMDKTIEYYEEDWRLAQFLHYELDAVQTRHQHGSEPHPHGNELEGFEGYLDLYRYTGKPYYLNAVINCIDLYKHHWQHTGGGISMCERFIDKKYGKRSIYDDPKYTYNELCSSAFWMQLHQRLHRLYPHREDHVFEMEQSLYNIIFANQVNDTHIRTFAWLDGYKRRIAFPRPLPPNHCCAGMATKIFASLPEYLYTMNKNTLSCDIYAANELMWDTDIQTIKVTEETDFPYDGKVKLTFEPEKTAQDFTLRLRIPHYTEDDVKVYINGEFYIEAKRGTYLEIFRNWKNGDTVSFEIKFAFKEHLYYGDDDVEGYTRCAYTYGPILLTVVGEKNHENGIVINGTPQEFISKLIPQDRPFYYNIEGEENSYVAPYFEIGEVEMHCYPMFQGIHKPEEPEPPYFGVQIRPWIRD